MENDEKMIVFFPEQTRSFPSKYDSYFDDSEHASVTRRFLEQETLIHITLSPDQ